MLIGLVAPYFFARGMPGKGLRISMFIAWTFGMLSLSIWFLPALINASLSSNAIRFVELATLLAGGVAFWWPLFAHREQHSTSAPHPALSGHAAATWCSLLGNYSSQKTAPGRQLHCAAVDGLHIADSLLTDWSFSRETDQQTAGLLATGSEPPRFSWAK